MASNYNLFHLHERRFLFRLTAFIIMLLVVFSIYGNTLEHPFIFDDTQNILLNTGIRINSINYDSLQGVLDKSALTNRPVANISLALNYYFHQYKVTGYHLFNITIHFLNGILLFLFLEQTLNLQTDSRKSVSRWLAFASALVWVVHPLHIQSVTYIIQRMNSMMTMFYLLGLILYIQARNSATSWTRWFCAIGAVTAGLLAIGSKENAIMMPFFIVLYELFFFQKLKFKWQKRQYIIILSAVMIFLIGTVFAYLGSHPFESLLKSYGVREFSLGERLLTQPRVIIFYISQILLPLPSRLNLEHDFTLSYSLLNPPFTLFALLGVFSMILLAIFLAKRDRLLSFCLFWFLGNLIIESTIIPLEIIFEHRTYLPSMLLILFLVLVTHKIISTRSHKIIILCLIFSLFASLTYTRNAVWSSGISIMEDMAKKSPNKFRIQHNFGRALGLAGRLDEAVFHLRKAVELNPKHEIGYESLGQALMSQKKYLQAAEAFSKGLKVKPSAMMQFEMGRALALLGKHNNAIYYYNKALTGNRFIKYKVLYHLGLSLSQLGKHQKAIDKYNQALLLKPNYWQAQEALINAKQLTGHKK